MSSRARCEPRLRGAASEFAADGVPIEGKCSSGHKGKLRRCNYFGAEYPSPKKVGLDKPQKVKGYLLSP